MLAGKNWLRLERRNTAWVSYDHSDGLMSVYVGRETIKPNIFSIHVNFPRVYTPEEQFASWKLPGTQ